MTTLPTTKPLRILAVDVGTGTQDVLLFESDRTIENCLQLVMPSPTVIVAARIARATASGRPLLLTGRTMGGGPSAWAARDHALAGFPCYATVDAARTLDDDLDAVAGLGIHIVEDAEARALLDAADAALVHVVLRDVDVAALRAALTAFDVDPEVDLVAVAAFDHGAAPRGYSDRRFRFEYIEHVVRADPRPLAFAHRAADLPHDLTRLHAVAADAAAYLTASAHPPADPDACVFVMDTGAAAVAGALEDPTVRGNEHCLVANIGNFHALAFSLRAGRILGLFEHHTGELNREKLEGYLRDLATGTLENDTIFADSGHGALMLAPAATSPRAAPAAMPFLAVTGPRRELLRGSVLNPYEAVPHGDMMLAGCYGLLRGVSALAPEHAAAIEQVLGPAH